MSSQIVIFQKYIFYLIPLFHIFFHICYCLRKLPSLISGSGSWLSGIFWINLVSLNHAHTHFLIWHIIHFQSSTMVRSKRNGTKMIQHFIKVGEIPIWWTYMYLHVGKRRTSTQFPSRKENEEKDHSVFRKPTFPLEATDLKNWKRSLGRRHHYPLLCAVNSKGHQGATFLNRCEQSKRFSEDYDVLTVLKGLTKYVRTRQTFQQNYKWATNGCSSCTLIIASISQLLGQRQIKQGWDTTVILSTFSWAAVGSVMIWPSLSMAQVTPQNRQLIGRPESIRVIQAAFKKHDKSWKICLGKGTRRRNYIRVLIITQDSKGIFWRILSRHRVTLAEQELTRNEGEVTGEEPPRRSLEHIVLVIVLWHLGGKTSACILDSSSFTAITSKALLCDWNKMTSNIQFNLTFSPFFPEPPFFQL